MEHPSTVHSFIWQRPLTICREGTCSPQHLDSHDNTRYFSIAGTCRSRHWKPNVKQLTSIIPCNHFIQNLNRTIKSIKPLWSLFCFVLEVFCVLFYLLWTSVVRFRKFSNTSRTFFSQISSIKGRGATYIWQLIWEFLNHVCHLQGCWWSLSHYAIIVYVMYEENGMFDGEQSLLVNIHCQVCTLRMINRIKRKLQMHEIYRCTNGRTIGCFIRFC